MKKKLLLTLLIILLLIAAFVFRIFFYKSSDDNRVVLQDTDGLGSVEFLGHLIDHPEKTYSIIGSKNNWITYEDARLMLDHLDSTEPCAPVVSSLSSYLPMQSSTAGREAAFMIEGFLWNEFPPALHSENFAIRSYGWYSRQLDKYPLDIVKVSDINELVLAIASDTLILLAPGEYMIDAADFSKIDNPNVRIDERTGGLVIQNIQDLTIAGTGREKIDVLTGNMNADVLVFEDSQGISLANIRAGHINEDKGCFGSVICFRNSSDIYLEGCSLFGCGINGLELNDVSGFMFADSEIYDCSFHIMCMSNSEDIRFSGSSFHDNRGTTLINISGCDNVVFENCEIIENEAVTDTAALFALDMSDFSPYVNVFERNDKDSEVILKDTIVQKHIVRTAPSSRAVIEYIDVLEPGG
jgi:hypothetical protein